MIDAVLDTNVVVSALLRPKSLPDLVLRLALGERIRCFVSEALLVEYEDVLGRLKLDISTRLTKITLQQIRRSFTTVVPVRQVAVAPDADDNKVLECALEARAEFIITGNLRHFPARFQGIRILAPRDFLTVFQSEL
jgi:putative PIN family toxin of toxin-antitoxin system